MSASWPIEALKAQAVCARTYVLASHKHTGFDVCATDCCQVYQGLGRANDNSDAAVDQTAGQYMTYNGELCIAYYSSCDGGATENSENVWNEAVPYLRGVVDPYEANIADTVSGYRWTVTYTPSEITTRLRNKGYSVGTIVSMTVSQYTDMGNVYKVTLVDSNGVKWNFTKGDSIRSALGVSSIRFTINGDTPDTYYINGSSGTITGSLETSYAVGSSGVAGIIGHSDIYAITGTGDAVEPDDQAHSTSDNFVLSGTGKGHNVGMSQWGAYSMAKYYNMTYDQILHFYYTGVTIG
jgi:stage II sporulation protein D